MSQKTNIHTKEDVEKLEGFEKLSLSAQDFVCLLLKDKKTCLSFVEDVTKNSPGGFTREVYLWVSSLKI